MFTSSYSTAGRGHSTRWTHLFSSHHVSMFHLEACYPPASKTQKGVILFTSLQFMFRHQNQVFRVKKQIANINIYMKTRRTICFKSNSSKYNLVFIVLEKPHLEFNGCKDFWDKFMFTTLSNVTRPSLKRKTLSALIVPVYKRDSTGNFWCNDKVFLHTN